MNTIKILTVGCVLLLIVSLVGCEGPSQSPNPTLLTGEAVSARPNVVLISIDTLRSDHLGSWGFPHGYSPVMDQLARQGVIFQSMFTVIPHTTPAHASLLTGCYPMKHGSRDNAFPIDTTVPTLAESLASQGYKTAGSVGHFLVSGPTSGLDRGFEKYWAPASPGMEPSVNAQGKKVFPLATNEYRPWQNVNQHAETWLQTVTDPWFLFLHYYECHAAHNPPFPWSELSDLHPYDGEIAGIDHAISDVLRMLSERGLLDTTEIIITADHGESLGEHNYFGHGYGLYYPSMGTPWITWGGKQASGIRTGLARIMDIMPTILHHRRLPIPPELDGRANADGVLTAFGESPSLFPAEPQRRIRSLRETDFTMIRKKNAGQTELYDRQNDPAETNDISTHAPQKLQEMNQTLDGYTAPDQPIVLSPEEQLEPEVVDALKSLGYLE